MASPREEGQAERPHLETEGALSEQDASAPASHSLDDYFLEPIGKPEKPETSPGRKLIVAALVMGFLYLVIGPQRGKESSQSSLGTSASQGASSSRAASSGEDPQLWETGKDYVFWRAKIIACTQEGNESKAERARREMRTSERYLFNTNWTQTQATEAVRKAEEHYSAHPIRGC